MVGGESESAVKYHGESPEQLENAKMPPEIHEPKHDVNDPFDGDPNSKIARQYRQPSASPDKSANIPLPQVFQPSICLMVNNEYDLRKFLAECEDDIDNYAPNSMFNLKMPNYSQTLSQENLHYSTVSKASKSKKTLKDSDDGQIVT